MDRSRSALAVLAAAALVTLASPGYAQVTSALTLNPWPDKAHIETTDDIIVESKGHTMDARGGELTAVGGVATLGGLGGAGGLGGLALATPQALGQAANALTGFNGGPNGQGDASHIWMWESEGRLRLSDQDQYSPSIGYRWLMIDTGVHPYAFSPTSDDFPTSGYQNISLAAQYTVYRTDDLHLSLIAGAGYAGNSPFDDDKAFYGIGHVVLTKNLNKTDSLTLTLDYQGDSAFLPDIPLPGIAYQHKGPVLEYTIGYPHDAIVWHPLPKLTLEGSYTVPYTALARASYELFPNFSLYTLYKNVYEGFHLSNDADDDERIFFQQRRAEIGVRYVLGKWIDATLGVGYAMDQETQRGFDARNVHDSTRFTDEPYLALMLRGTF